MRKYPAALLLVSIFVSVGVTAEVEAWLSRLA